jgi:hypothetical protein
MTISEIKGAETDGARIRPNANGSNKNPHEPCSIGRAIDFAGTLDLGLIAVAVADIYYSGSMLNIRNFG